MTGVTLAALAEVPGPSPDLDPYTVTPGIGGFLVFFALALAAWFLYRSFVKHMRRVQVRAKLEAEAREAAGASRADVGDPTDAESDAGEPTDAGEPIDAGPVDGGLDGAASRSTDTRRDRR